MIALADPLALVASLCAPYGVERSIKFAPGRVLEDRYLASVHRDALGPDPIEALTAMGRALAMPGDALDALPHALEGAQIIHFGWEREPEGEIFKLYFEYAAAVRAAMNARPARSALVHRAFKWRPGPAGALNVTLYTWQPCRTYREIEAQLADPAFGGSPGALCAQALLRRIERSTGAGEVMLMRVEEEGNPRRSLDINLYRADLRVGTVQDLFAQAAGDLAAPLQETQAALSRCAEQPLGHLSLGVARDGAPFFTIYFGVEGH